MRVQDAVHVLTPFLGGQWERTLCGLGTRGLLFAPIDMSKVETLFGTPAADTLCPLCVPLDEPW